MSQCPWPCFLGMVLNSSLPLFLFLLCLSQAITENTKKWPAWDQAAAGVQPREAQVQQESSEAGWQLQGLMWKCKGCTRTRLSLPTLGPRQHSASCHQRGLWSRQRPSGLTASLVLVSAEADEATAQVCMGTQSSMLVPRMTRSNAKMPQPPGTSLSNLRAGSDFTSLALQELEL